MNANTGRTVLGSLLPILGNPAALAAIGIGAAGWVIYSLITEDEEENSDNTSKNGLSNGSEPFDEPYEAIYETVTDTVPERLNAVVSTVPATICSTVDEPLQKRPGSNETQAPSPNDYDEEQAKKEMIRQTMSELGKRSAAARAKRKQDGE